MGVMIKEYEELGNKLKTIRQSQQKNATGVARLLKISPAYFSRVENGRDRPSLEMLSKIAKAYSLELDDVRLLEKLAGYGTSPRDEEAGNVAIGGQVQMEVKINPEKTPIMFSDAIFVVVSDNGVVFDFCQKVTQMNKFEVVSRIGVSQEHAIKIHKLLGEQLQKASNRKIEDEK